MALLRGQRRRVISQASTRLQLRLLPAWQCTSRPVPCASPSSMNAVASDGERRGAGKGRGKEEGGREEGCRV